MKMVKMLKSSVYKRGRLNFISLPAFEACPCILLDKISQATRSVSVAPVIIEQVVGKLCRNDCHKLTLTG